MVQFRMIWGTSILRNLYIAVLDVEGWPPKFPFPTQDASHSARRPNASSPKGFWRAVGGSCFWEFALDAIVKMNSSQSGKAKHEPPWPE